MSAYHMVATGQMDAHLMCKKALVDGAQMSECADAVTHFRTRAYKHFPFAMDTYSQNFNSQTTFGRESQVTLNRSGDLAWFMYLHVELPGIVGCDGADAASCPGLGPGSAYPVAAGQGRDKDTAFFRSRIPNFENLGADEQERQLTEARNAWRRNAYGEAAEISCCVGEADDSPEALCEELVDSQMWCTWINNVGHGMIKEIKLNIGGVTIDKITGLQMACWEEMTGRAGKRLTEMTGRRYTQGQIFCDSRADRHLYIPIPFWFAVNSGAALPLMATTYHYINIHVTFEPLHKLIVVGSPSVAVRCARTGYAITPQDLVASLETTYIYLTDLEITKWTNPGPEGFKQLIVQHQSLSMTVPGRGASRINVNFNHPNKMLFIVVRRQSNLDQNSWLNFSGVDGRDPIKSLDLKLNSTSRFTNGANKPASYWRTVVPYQFFSNIPETFIYCVNFALRPEDTINPSGSLNLSKIDNVELVLDMQDALAGETVQVDIMSRNWNMLRFADGVAGISFT